MIIIKNIFKNLLIAIMLSVMMQAITTTAHAQEITLRLHQFLPPQANVPKLILDVWINKIEKDSNNRIKINHFPSMQLGGKPPELIDHAIDGIADIIWTVTGYTPGRFPRSEVFELPFIMNDAEAASRAFWNMYETHMKKTEFKDVYLLATWVHGPGVLHTKRPVKTPQDLRGMQIRGGSRQVNALLKKLGAIPIGMPVPAVPEALSKGVLDGTTIPWEVTTTLKIPEMVHNHTEFSDTALYTLTFILAMNQERYDSLPADLQAIIDQNSGFEFSARAARIQANADLPARQIALDNGNRIITINAEQTEIWRKLSLPLYSDWVNDMNKRGIDGQALIDQAQRLMQKYTR